MFLWSPSNSLTSLRQILKLSWVESSTQNTRASWGLTASWWLGVTSIVGGAEKRWKIKGKKNTGAACIANQLSSAVPLEPSLNSNTQALNPFWFSDSSQIAVPLPPFGFLTEWPNEVKTLTSCPLPKGSEYRTCLQANRFPLDVLTLSFPTL